MNMMCVCVRGGGYIKEYLLFPFSVWLICVSITAEEEQWDSKQRWKQTETHRRTDGRRTRGLERGAVGQAVVLGAVERLDAAPDRLWLEVSLGPAAGRGYPGGGEREGGDSNQSRHFLSGGRPDAPRGNGPAF